MTYDIVPSAEEIKNRCLSKTSLETALTLFDLHGVLTIKEVLPKSHVKTVKADFHNQYIDPKNAGRLASSPNLGVGRVVLSLDFKDSFGERSLYANPFVFPLLQTLLGQDFVMQQYTALVALPGAKSQLLHLDHVPLFPEAKRMSADIPSFAIVVAIPLVNITSSNGPTLVYPGSHRSEAYKKPPSSSSRITMVQAGSCYLWDYRILHSGLSNRTRILRPVLYIIYCRSWFKDASNFARPTEQHLKVRLSKAGYSKIPKKYQSLFRFVSLT